MDLDPDHTILLVLHPILFFLPYPRPAAYPARPATYPALHPFLLVLQLILLIIQLILLVLQRILLVSAAMPARPTAHTTNYTACQFPLFNHYPPSTYCINLFVINGLT
jgi:hypothetical protein